MFTALRNLNKYSRIIIIISIITPLLVALLTVLPQAGKLGNWDISFLPHLHGLFNSLTTLCLLVAFLAIRLKKIQLHRNFMMMALFISVLFFVSYIIYHFQAVPTLYGDTDKNGSVSEEEKIISGSLRYIYYFVLITHIALATIIVPFILFAFYYAFSDQIDKHKRLVKWTYPMWLYVAISGVSVYLMIRPYY